MTTVFIISAPSGSGKSTLVRWLMERDPKLLFSVSYTTRRRVEPRSGRELPFHHPGRLRRTRLRRGEFLEWAEVFGNYYGTHRSMLDRAIAEEPGRGTRHRRSGCATIEGSDSGRGEYFCPCSVPGILEQRLRSRSEDSEEVIQKRLREAAEEIRNYTSYDYVLVNDDLARSTRDAGGDRGSRASAPDPVEPVVRSILASFE